MSTRFDGRVKQRRVFSAYCRDKVSGMLVQAVVLAFLQGHGLHAFSFRNDLPTSPIEHQGTVIANKGDAVIASVGAAVDAIGMLPLHRKIVKLIDSSKRVGRFGRVIGISELAARSHN